MATLRKKANTTTNALLGKDDDNDDIESSIDDNNAATKTRLLLIASDEDTTTKDYSSNTTPTTTTTSLNHPFFLHAIGRRVLSLLLVDDDENDAVTNSKNNPSSVCEKILSLLRDILFGSILGLLTITCIMILDHADVIHLQSAHNFRNAAFQLLNDPETMSYMESNMNAKFLSVAEYNTTQREMDKAVREMERLQTLYEKRSDEGDEKKKVLDELSEEYDALLSNPTLGLDKFCGSCNWGGSGTCDDRVQYLVDKYGNSLLEAKLGVMESHGSCKKS